MGRAGAVPDLVPPPAPESAAPEERLASVLALTLFRDGVTGVKGDTKPRTTISWNIAEWDVR